MEIWGKYGGKRAKKSAFLGVKRRELLVANPLDISFRESRNLS